MSYIVNRKELVTALKNLKVLIKGRRHSLPILESVRIKEDNGYVTLSATDGETYLTLKLTSATTETPDPEGILVNLESLLKIAQKVDEYNISISQESIAEKITTHVAAGKSTFKIGDGFPVAEFPTFPTISPDSSFIIESVDLEDAIKFTKGAMSTDETRYVINGLYIEVVDDKVNFVATDGKVMALATKNVAADGTPAVIIPSKAVKVLEAVLKDAEGQVMAEVQGSKTNPNDKGTLNPYLKLSTYDFTLYTNPVNGQFPNYNQVIPKEEAFTASVNVESKPFLKAVDRVGLVGDLADRRYITPGIDVTLNGHLKVSAKIDSNEAEELVESSNLQGKISVRFNPEYLEKAVKAVNRDNVSLNFTTELGVSTIGDFPERFWGVMPLRNDTADKINITAISYNEPF